MSSAFNIIQIFVPFLSTIVKGMQDCKQNELSHMFRIIPYTVTHFSVPSWAFCTVATSLYTPPQSPKLNSVLLPPDWYSLWIKPSACCSFWGKLKLHSACLSGYRKLIFGFIEAQGKRKIFLLARWGSNFDGLSNLCKLMGMRN